MAMVESHRPMGGFGIDVPPYATGPHFNNPWHGEQSPDGSPVHMYPIPSPFNHTSKGESSMSHQMAYPSIPVSSATVAEANALNIHYQQTPELHPLNTDVSHGSPSTYRSSSESAFPPTPASASVSYHASVPSSAIQSSSGQQLEPTNYMPSHNQALEMSRRISSMSQPTVNNSYFASPLEMARHRHASMMDINRPMMAPQLSFDDSYETARAMTAPSQRPMSRSMYSRESAESLGYASSVSHTPSISSGYMSYPGSMSDSLTDMSSCCSESYDMHGTRLLPRPAGLLGGNMLPGPQSMMGQFSSKVASSSQKKHKCKVCDKRFTRPSSLQTHMYSHTGEKPYSCEVPGCGRHFSVVSNLRRHRKVHKHHEIGLSE